MDNRQIQNMIDRVEALSAQMDAENAKSHAEWEAILTLISKGKVPHVINKRTDL